MNDEGKNISRHCRRDGATSRFEESVWYDYPLPPSAHPVRILYIDRFRGQREKPEEYTIHRHWEFIGVISGNGWLESEANGCETMSSNAVFLIPPGTKHIELASGQMDLLWVGFELTFNAGSSPKDIVQLKNKDILQKMLQLWHFVSNRKAAIGLEMEGRLLTLIGMFFRYCRNPSPSGGMSVSEIPGYLDTHVASEVSVAELAQMCRMSGSHFSRQFHLLAGVGPNEYHLRRRLQAAMRYLSETDLSIAQIANLCGFKTSGYFARIFHARHGCPPGKFRTSVREARMECAHPAKDTFL